MANKEIEKSIKYLQSRLDEALNYNNLAGVVPELEDALAIIDQLRKENKRLKQLITDSSPHREAIQDKNKLLERIEQLEAKHAWIPVSERLPEVKHDILVFDKGNFIIHHAAMLVNGKFYDVENQVLVPYVTHWMPIILPEETK